LLKRLTISLLDLTQAIQTAHNIKRYEPIITNTIGIAFLGTPHRGANLADILKFILDASYAKTKFVNDLSPTSQAIKEINDAFGELAQGLVLASFWESAGTAIGVRPSTILKLILIRL
jgi:hypothetical protein